MKTNAIETCTSGQALFAFLDIAKNKPEEIVDFCVHCGIRREDITAAAGEGLARLYLGHYRVRRGQYDIARIASDLANWPPMAKEIAKAQAKLSATR